MTKDQALLILLEHYFNVENGHQAKWDLGVAINRLASDHLKISDEVGMGIKLRIMRARVIQWEAGVLR